MNQSNTKSGERLKRTIKTQIAKAWYQLDQKSYEQWLAGRRLSKKEASI